MVVASPARASFSILAVTMVQCRPIFTSRIWPGCRALSRSSKGIFMVMSSLLRKEGLVVFFLVIFRQVTAQIKICRIKGVAFSEGRNVNYVC